MKVIGIDASLSATGVSDGERHETITTNAADSLHDRCTNLTLQLAKFVPVNEEALWVVEAPLLRMLAHGGSHLYEAGWVMSAIYQLASEVACVGVFSETGLGLIEISNSSLKKWAFGKGNLDKAHVALAVYKKWGVEFANDRGVDQAHAFALHKYGCAVAAGEVEHVAAAERGSGKRAKASVRKRKRG